MDRRTLVNIVILSQIAKFLIIYVQADSSNFNEWFFGFAHHLPYSFGWFKIHGVDSVVPYSMIWYIVYGPLTLAGYWPYYLTTLTLDTMIVWIALKNHSSWYTLYVIQMGGYLLLNSPQDFLIWIFIFLARVRPIFLGLAVLVKAPLLPPILNWKLWNFILTSPASLHDPGNWFRYGVMISACSASLVLYWKDRHDSVNLRERPGIPLYVERPIGPFRKCRSSKRYSSS